MLTSFLLSVSLYVLTTLAIFGQARAIPVGDVVARKLVAEIFTLPSGGVTLTVVNVNPLSTQATKVPPTTTIQVPDDPVSTSSNPPPLTNSPPNFSTTPALLPTSSGNSTSSDSNFGTNQTSRISVSVLAIIVILSIIAIITAFIGLIFYIRTRRNTAQKLKGNSGANAIGGVYGPPSSGPRMGETTVRTPLNQSFGTAIYGGSTNTSYGYNSAYASSAGRAPIEYGAVPFTTGVPVQSGPYASDRELGQGASVYYTPKPAKPVRPQNPFADVTPSTQALEADSLERSMTSATSRSGKRLETPTPPPMNDLPPPPVPYAGGSGSRPASPGGSLWVSRKMPPGAISPAAVSPDPSFKF